MKIIITLLISLTSMSAFSSYCTDQQLSDLDAAFKKCSGFSTSTDVLYCRMALIDYKEKYPRINCEVQGEDGWRIKESDINKMIDNLPM